MNVVHDTAAKEYPDSNRHRPYEANRDESLQHPNLTGPAASIVKIIRVYDEWRSQRLMIVGPNTEHNKRYIVVVSYRRSASVLVVWEMMLIIGIISVLLINRIIVEY